MGQFDRLGTSSSADFYQAMFEGADLYMSFWQPMLKGIGRAQLRKWRNSRPSADNRRSLGRRACRPAARQWTC